MTDERKAEASSEKISRPKAEGIEIKRDVTFTRISADDAYVIKLGGDIELSLIAYGPDPTFRAQGAEHGDGKSDPNRIIMSPALWEVGRVRIDEGSMANIAMNILRTMIAGGSIDLVPFMEAIDEIIKGAPEDDLKNYRLHLGKGNIDA